ncbi:flagellar hook-associated protein FlgL [Alkalibacillus sp. S2W]|uniref:flagellar hook-associated protein FlgL n=1 Tax=Alkalibacillus sp. S2W TaxID=3386553 RepID=UPI00398C9BE6
MRVTQSMLSQNMMNNIQKNNSEMQKYMEQLSTGKKINRPSDDPVVAMKGVDYRSELSKVEQFERNMSEVNTWMDSSDEAMNEAGQALTRVRELVIQASNDTYEENQRGNMASEVEEIKNHLRDIANTQVNNKYIFNGTNTDNARFNEDGFVEAHNANGDLVPVINNSDDVLNEIDGQNGDLADLNIDDPNIERSVNQMMNHDNLDITTVAEAEDYMNNNMPAPNNNAVNIEVSDGVDLKANTNPSNTFSADMFDELNNIVNKLTQDDPPLNGDDFDEHLTTLDQFSQDLVNERADLGARMNRAELIETRLSQQEVTTTDLMSQNEDADLTEVITNLRMQENVHRASLSAGSRIIQPTLMDFLR